MKTLHALAADLVAGKTTSEKLTRECLEKITDPAGEGQRAFIKVYAEAAIATARASDVQRANGVVASPLAGIPISIKHIRQLPGELSFL